MWADEIDDLPVELLAHVARTLFGPDAERMTKLYEEGWIGFFPGDPLSLGLAAVSPITARRVIEFRPELEGRIRAMQANPEKALEELVEELRREAEE